MTNGLPNIFLFSDDIRLPDPFPLLAKSNHNIGLIFRNYRQKNRQNFLRTHLSKLKNKHQSVLLGVNKAPVSFYSWEIEGLHYPGHILTSHHACIYNYQARNKGWQITASVHSTQELLRARALKIHNYILSPIYPTSSHPGSGVLGHFPALLFLHRHKKAQTFWLMGGISPTKAKRLHYLKQKNIIAGFAGISAVHQLA